MGQGLIQTPAFVHSALSFLPWQFLTLSKSNGFLNDTYLPAKWRPTAYAFRFTDIGEIQRKLEGLCFMVTRRFQTLLHGLRFEADSLSRITWMAFTVSPDSWSL